MAWVIGVIVVLVVLGFLRRVLRGRTSPQIDQQRLENANYARIGQDVHNMDQRFGHGR